MHYLLRLDTHVFHLINRDWHAHWLDVVMPFITNLHNTILQNPPVFWFLIALILIWILRGKAHAARAICATILAVGMADSFCTFIVKPIFKRPRPNSAHIGAILRTIRAISYSFPSNHAANSFAAASTIGFFYPWTRIFLLPYAAAVAYSRVYCGVHYPLDILVGSIIGICVSFLSARLVNQAADKIESWRQLFLQRAQAKRREKLTKGE